METTTKRFFLKEILSNSLSLKGRKIEFEDLGDNTGGLVLDDTPENKDLIAALDNFAARRTGGVIKATSEEYDAAKKALSVSGPARDARRAPGALLNPYGNSLPRLAAVPNAIADTGPKTPKPADPNAPAKVASSLEHQKAPAAPNLATLLKAQEPSSNAPVATPLPETIPPGPAVPEDAPF